MIAEDPALVSLVEATVAGMGTDDSNRLRPGLRAHDVAQFIIATALSLLLHTVPGTSDPDVTRRYLQTFVLRRWSTTPAAFGCISATLIPPRIPGLHAAGLSKDVAPGV